MRLACLVRGSITLDLRSRRRSTELLHRVLTPRSNPDRISPYLAARRDWNRRLAEADKQAQAWRTAALASMTVLVMLLSLAVPLEDVRSFISSRNTTPGPFEFPVP